MVKKNIETVADKINAVLSTTHSNYDSDENLDDTHARLEAPPIESDDEEELILSKLRKENVDLLEDVDKRYIGKKTSRNSLNYSDESSENEEQSENGDAETSDEDMENESQGSNTEQSDEEGEEGSSGSEDEMEYKDDSEINEEVGYGNDDNFKHINKTDLSSEVKKGLSIRNQMKMWESLLEMRIQLQKCLITANKMPQTDTFGEIQKQSGQEFTNQFRVTKYSVGNVLDKLLLLQKLVLKKYPETRNLHNKKDEVSNEGSDEEISSDMEGEKSAEESEEGESEIPKKKRKFDDLEKEIAEQHNRYKKYRNSVIEKWNEKTRIATMKNNTNSHSIIKHIEHTLSDRSKLIKRTQLKRSDYTILGKALPTHDEKQNEDTQDVRPVEEFSSEIYDDDDFYHQLLRELIEVKSADLTDPVQLGRQWIQLQNLRSKMKRKIDTRATKGRKIRYTVHTKLVNFMAPIDQSMWTDAAKTELYNSLFEKNLQFGNK